jgi:hypothetical protein
VTESEGIVQRSAMFRVQQAKSRVECGMDFLKQALSKETRIATGISGGPDEFNMAGPVGEQFRGAGKELVRGIYGVRDQEGRIAHVDWDAFPDVAKLAAGSRSAGSRGGGDS